MSNPITFITIIDVADGAAALVWRNDQADSVGFGALDLNVIAGFSYGAPTPIDQGDGTYTVVDGPVPTLLIYLRSGTALQLTATDPGVFTEVVDRLTPQPQA